MSEANPSFLGEGVKAEIKALIKEAVQEAIGQNEYGRSPTLLTLEKAARNFGVPKSWIADAAPAG